MWYYQAIAAREASDMAKQKPKDKGTAAETAVVQWAKKHGFYTAVRIALTGSKDTGDVRIASGVMAQVKNGYTEHREPTDFQVGEWLAQMEKQQKNGQWQYALLVHKRYGKSDPDMWRWFLTGQTFLTLTTPLDVVWTHVPPYVQLQGYMIPPLLLSAGVNP